ADLGRDARQFTLANFSLDQIRKNYEELYGELLARKSWQPTPARRLIPVSQGSEPLRVAVVAASLRYVGGQSVQADLLVRQWQNDPEISAKYIEVDPAFPRPLGWMERIPVLRTIIRTPLYAASLWRELADADIAHVFSASYWSFLVAPVPAWLIARMRGK